MAQFVCNSKVTVDFDIRYWSTVNRTREFVIVIAALAARAVVIFDSCLRKIARSLAYLLVNWIIKVMTQFKLCISPDYILV